MKKLARAHIGLVIARALYKDRELHRADFVLLRAASSRAEKIAIVRRMLARSGKSTAAAWLPGSILWGLEQILSHRDRRQEARPENTV